MNGYQEIAEVAQAAHPSTRVIFCCKRCPIVRSFEYLSIDSQLVRVLPDYLATPESDLRCPCGSRFVDSGHVVGTVTSKPCSEACQDAHNFVCKCSCGGANHGMAHRG